MSVFYTDIFYLMISRDERQQICVNKWLASRGVGTLIQPTG